VARIVVTGGGIVGLGTALLLAEDGHQVTVLERDPAPPPEGAEPAWAHWERRGVNQFRMLHMFLPRLREILETELPAVLDALDARGALRANVLDQLPASVTGGTRAGDERYAVVTGRRPVFEAAVAEVADAHAGITVRRGVAVTGLLTGSSATEHVPHVTGVRVEGEDLAADLVVDCTGRRSPLPRWLTEIGARAPVEELDDCGFVYYGRHFRSADGDQPPLLGPALQHHDSISTITLGADNGTYAVAVITSARDTVMRGLKDPDAWTTIVRSHPLVAHWVDAECLQETVAVMARIEDRHRSFVVDGAPVATGVLAVGDSWACTNPSVGRGASIGMCHAVATRDLLREWPLSDPTGLALAHHDATLRAVEPWFRSTLRFDRLRLAEVEAQIAETPFETEDPTWPFRKAMDAAAMVDPAVLRSALDDAFLFRTLEEMMDDHDVAERVRAAGGGAQDRPILGPTRADLVALVS
jgi:2-polyprenyl-6-methoxyphenol hydroxylase-like FAD-dependent oxidoreductase